MFVIKLNREEWRTNKDFDISADLLQHNSISTINFVVLNSNVWQGILTNNKLIAQQGSANAPFEKFDRKTKGFQVVLRAIPWMTFIVVDDGFVTGDEIRLYKEIPEELIKE